LNDKSRSPTRPSLKLRHSVIGHSSFHICAAKQLAA